MKKHKISLALLAFFGCLTLSSGQTTPNNPEYIKSGSKVTLIASADGVPSPSFQWFRDGVAVGTGDTYTITNLSPDTVGKYSVKASNIAGEATSEPVEVKAAVAPSLPSIRISVDVTIQVQQTETKP